MARKLGRRSTFMFGFPISDQKLEPLPPVLGQPICWVTHPSIALRKYIPQLRKAWGNPWEFWALIPMVSWSPPPLSGGISLGVPHFFCSSLIQGISEGAGLEGFQKAKNQVVSGKKPLVFSKKHMAKLRTSILKSWKMMTDKISQSGNCSFKAWDLS